MLYFNISDIDVTNACLTVYYYGSYDFAWRFWAKFCLHENITLLVNKLQFCFLLFSRAQTNMRTVR